MIFENDGRKPHILVIGDLIIDQYLTGDSERISPEAPVQIVNITSEEFKLGGAGNVVNNLVEFGSRVSLISVIGTCEVAKKLKKLLLEKHINTDLLIEEDSRKSSKKTRIISGNQQVIRFDSESIDVISKNSSNKIIRALEDKILEYDLLILSDYGKGILGKNLTQSIIKIASKFNKKVLVDPKGLDFEKYSGSFLLTPNKSEASGWWGRKLNSLEDVEKCSKNLKDQLNLSYGLITLSNEGIGVYDKSFKLFPTKAKEVFDVTGAGDTVIAALGFALASNFDMQASVQFANLAAGVVVSKIGSSVVSLQEIKYFYNKKDFYSFEEIKVIVDNLKKESKDIIFTNGCFDIIHSGHVTYLKSAKALGDILIVGLNSDSSVKKLKGDTRPINNESHRSSVLSAIKYVDYVVIFNDETPYELIKTIKPKFLVKGGDYAGKDIVGSEFSENVRTVDFIKGISTSEIINKIRE